MKIITDYLSELKAKIRLLPTDLKWLFWFSAPLFFVCTLPLIFAREQLFEEIIPYTGWSPGFIYGVLAFITLQKTSLEPNENNLVNFVYIRYKAIFILGICLILGIYDWFDTTAEYYTHTNPYLRYEPLRPIYAIFLPLFWILIIGWTLMMIFFRKESKVSD
nr:hypothetical protein [uncultured Flavobacterium sp.]